MWKKEVVYFFGGYNSTQPQVDAWVRDAKMQEPTIEFIGFAWPNFNNLSSSDAITKIKESDPYKAMVAAIEASKADTYYLVGHSSGCAIANDADKGLSDTSKVTLVSLD